MNINEIIKNNKKKTLVRVYMNKRLYELKDNLYDYVVIGEWHSIKKELDKYNIDDYKVETLCVNSAIDLLDIRDKHARIEYGAIIRDNVEIGNEVVILMGAIINSGCIIGDKTMIDMGAVLGGNVIVKENCHIGANAVLAGTVEPYSEQNVVINKNSFIGAGAVVLEGIHIGENCIIGANSVVNKDIPDNCVAVGVPARIIKRNHNIKFIDEGLRKIDVK